MRKINNKLYIEFHEAVSAGIPERTLRDAKTKGRKCWEFIEDPDDRRRVLIGYEDMREKYKAVIIAWLKKKAGCKHEGACNCGDPYAHMALEPIREMIRTDDKAEAFYTAYRYDGPTGSGRDSLPLEHVEKYTRQASLLNFLVSARKDKKLIKRQLKIRMDVFYERVLELNRLDGYGLPSTYSNLLATLRKFEKNNYTSLIDWRFGNTIAQKVNDDVAQSLLLELIADGNQHDDVYIAMAYNAWAVKNGYEAITPATVGVWRRKNEYLVLASRASNATWYDKFGKEIQGYRPTQPLYMTEHDDNAIDLQFIDPDDPNRSSKFHHRYTAIVVIDSFNDYVLGYAYTDKAINSEVIRAAWINAMYHIRALTGAWYLPHELKTDNWGKGALKDWYSGFAHYTESPTGSKRGRGYIEQFFGSSLWKRCLKIGANNYTGNNMTAKFRGVNEEMVRANMPHRPTLEEGHGQIEQFFNRLRMTTGKSGKSKQQEWVEAWVNLPDEEKRPITDEQFLMKFGIRHMPKNGSRNRITNAGVECQINNAQYSFTVPYALYLTNVNKQINVIYDPYDMTRVLITDDERLRFIARETTKMPRAMRDYNKGDRTALNRLLDEKRDDSRRVAEAQEARHNTLRAQGIDPLAILQSGVLDKELRQQALAEASYDNDDNETFDPYSLA